MSFVYDMDYKFEDCMGNIFSRIIKEEKQNLEEIYNVVEFAPGFRYKIACALSKINFKGNLYIIDLNKNVLDYVYNRYKEILPDANIICLESNLKNSINKLPKKIDLFLSNHCIDDMIIGEFIDKNRNFGFGNDECSKEFLLNEWNKLEENISELEKIKENVYNEISFFIDNTDIDFFIISQYKSAYYVKEKSNVEINAREILNRLKSKFIINKEKLKNAMEIYIEDFDEGAEFEELGFKNNIQNIENWIAGRKK